MSARIPTWRETGGDWGLGYLLGMPFRTRRTPRARLEAMCDRRLAWLVRHAALTMPFYRELLELHGIDPASKYSWSDVASCRVPAPASSDAISMSAEYTFRKKDKVVEW